MSTTMRFTLAEYDRLIERQVLDEIRQRRIELIEGELREMTPAGPTHESVIDFLTRWSIENTSRSQALVRVQNSIALPDSDSAPEPDLAWVKPKDYRDYRPMAEDVLLVIEVSDSSLVFDQRDKAQLYAQAGIPEYWIVNLPHWRIDCHRDPVGETYQAVRGYQQADTISPLLFPDIQLTVPDLFRR